MVNTTMLSQCMIIKLVIFNGAKKPELTGVNKAVYTTASGEYVGQGQ